MAPAAPAVQAAWEAFRPPIITAFAGIRPSFPAGRHAAGDAPCWLITFQVPFSSPVMLEGLEGAWRSLEGSPPEWGLRAAALRVCGGSNPPTLAAVAAAGPAPRAPEPRELSLPSAELRRATPSPQPRAQTYGPEPSRVGPSRADCSGLAWRGQALPAWCQAWPSEVQTMTVFASPRSPPPAQR